MLKFMDEPTRSTSWLNHAVLTVSLGLNALFIFHALDTKSAQPAEPRTIRAPLIDAEAGADTPILEARAEQEAAECTSEASETRNVSKTDCEPDPDGLQL
ncbi:MAG: hypothetical protein AAFQ82_17405 [Myxococcota bacterium]